MGTEQSKTAASRIEELAERLRLYASGVNKLRGHFSPCVEAADLLTHLKPVLEENERLREAVEQYRNAPYRSADWLANEAMTIFGIVANDAHPLTER
jgi:hypothetical protein